MINYYFVIFKKNILIIFKIIENFKKISKLACML